MDIKKLARLLDRVECRADGSVASLVGKDAVQIAALATVLTGLRLERDTGGRMRLTRGPSCRKRAKELTGLRTNDYDRLIARVEIMLEEQKRKVVYVTAGEGECPPET